MADPEKQGHMSRAFHWVKLLITSAPLLKGLAVILITFMGLGTATNPMIQEQLAAVFESEPPLPIPVGQVPPAPTVSPDDSAFKAQVRQSLTAINAAVNQQSAQIEALKAELSEVEERRENESNRMDLKLEEMVKKNAAHIDELMELVN
jgi:hypothetical protein